MRSVLNDAFASLFSLCCGYSFELPRLVPTTYVFIKKEIKVH